MVGVSVGAAVGFAFAVGAGVAVGVAVAVGVDVAIGSGVGPEQAARVAMSIRMIGVAWMIVRSTGGFLFLRGVHPPFCPSLITVPSTIPVLCPAARLQRQAELPPSRETKGTWPTSGTILKDGAILVRRALVRNFATGIEIVEDEAVLT